MCRHREFGIVGMGEKGEGDFGLRSHRHILAEKGENTKLIVDCHLGMSSRRRSREADIRGLLKSRGQFGLRLGYIWPILRVEKSSGGTLAGIQIGELLVEQGVLTEAQVRHILQVQKVSNRPFGDLAERLFGIDPKAVEDAWVEQYLRMAVTVDLDDQEIDTDCLRLLNRRQAWQFRLLPQPRGWIGQHGDQRLGPCSVDQLRDQDDR